MPRCSAESIGLSIHTYMRAYIHLYVVHIVRNVHAEPKMLMIIVITYENDSYQDHEYITSMNTRHAQCTCYSSIFVTIPYMGFPAPSCIPGCTQSSYVSLWLSCLANKSAVNITWRPYNVTQMFSRSIYTWNKRNRLTEGFSQPV